MHTCSSIARTSEPTSCSQRSRLKSFSIGGRCLQTSCARSDKHESEAGLIYGLSMIAPSIHTLSPHYATMLQAGRLHALVTEIGGSPAAFFASWPCINLCALAFVFVCAQAFRNDGNTFPPPPLPSPTHPPSPAHNCNSTYHSPKTANSKKHTKSTRFFTSLFPPKRGTP